MVDCRDTATHTMGFRYLNLEPVGVRIYNHVGELMDSVKTLKPGLESDCGDCPRSLGRP